MEPETETALLLCEAKQGGSKGDGPIGRRMQSEKGGSERSERWWGKSTAFSLQKDAVDKGGVVWSQLARAKTA